MNNKSVSLILFSSLTSLLTACGGGGSPSNNNQSTNPVTTAQPTVVSNDNWQSARTIQVDNSMENTVEVIGSELIVNVTSTDISEGQHLQIYLNTDNKAETGFQFDNQAWVESGVDFLIEDGDLFKSTANNTGWNWNVNVGEIDYSVNGDNVTANLDLSLLGDICNNIKVGVMTRDEFWDISTFSPASAQMQTFTVSYCNTETPDTVKPVITLLGANPLNLTIGSELIDLGATALDDVDGDITSNIITTSTVDTSVIGTYSVNYSVSDAAGNSSEISRVVKVNEDTSTVGIVVDGNINDWNNIPTHASSADAIMKVSDDLEKIYILVTSNNLGDNIQVLMDTDNNAATGLNLSSQIATWIAGADHMIENNSLDKSQSNSTWSWDYGISPIEFLKTSDVLEIAIKKSDIESLADQIPMGYVSRTESWNVNYILPEQTLPTYTLLFPTPEIPVIANNDSATTNINTPVTIEAVGNDITNSGSGEVSIISANTPSNGTAVIVNGQIVYVPNAGYVGIDIFTYTITNSNGETATAIVTVTIETAKPDAQNDSAFLSSNSSVLIDVLTNDTSNSGSGELTITSVGSPSNGTALFTIGKIAYTPNTGFLGTDDFTYTITDSNGETATATVTVTIEAGTPDAQNDSARIISNSPVIIDVLDNDTTYSGSGQLTITSISPPSNGTTVIVNGQVVYRSNISFIGTDSFTYTITDSNGITATATVTVVVFEKPEAQNDSASSPYNSPVTIDVLDNDSTNSGSNELTITSIGSPFNGSAQIVNRQIRYTPNNGFSGTDIFTYTITDSNGETDTATITVTVIAFDEPVAVNDSVTTQQNTAVTISALNNDTSNSGSNELTITNAGSPSNGNTQIVNGQIRYTPNNGFSGTDIFTYTITDSNGETDTATITVTVIAFDEPVAVSDSVTTQQNTAVTINALNNDTSNSGSNQLTLSGIAIPSNGTAQIAAGEIVYTPNTGYIGTDSFIYVITDSNSETAIASVTVTVTAPPNNAPVANNDSATTVGINTVQIAVTSNDTDEDNDNLQITGFTSPANGSITLSVATATFNYTPNATFSGVDTFNYTISDGRGGTATATVSVTVPVNNAPDAVEDVATVYYNQTITVDVLANDTDPDGDTLSIAPESVFAITEGISATLNSDGTILVNPEGTVASLSVSYTVTDGRGGTDTAVLTLASTNPDDGNISFPTVSNEFVNTPYNTSIFVDVLANDFDSDGDTLSIDMVDDPANGTTQKVTQNGIAGILYTPDPGFVGVDIFYYGVPDGRGNNGSGFVEVTVLPPIVQ